MDNSSSQTSLQRYISQTGHCSRRKAAVLIAEGKVKIDGIVCLQPWQPLSLDQKIEVQGVNIRSERKRKQIYLALHKPPGYLSTNSDPHGRPCAIELVQPIYSERLFHVGRLDKNSSGLLFFTNDGYFAQTVQHPSNAIEKEYEVKTRKNIPEFVMEHWMRGITIDGQHYKLQSYRLLGSRQVQLVLSEGLNREIRRVFEHFHIPLKRVHRLRIGNVRLRGLSPGEFRAIKPFEIKSLQSPSPNEKTYARFPAPKRLRRNSAQRGPAEHQDSRQDKQQRRGGEREDEHYSKYTKDTKYRLSAESRRQKQRPGNGPNRPRGLYNSPSKPYTAKPKPKPNKHLRKTSQQGHSPYENKSTHSRGSQFPRTKAASQAASRAARPQRRRSRHT